MSISTANAQQKMGVSPNPLKVLKRITELKGKWTNKGWVFPKSIGVDLEYMKLSKLPLIAEAGVGLFCSHNNLTSLEGCPKYINGPFWCDDNCLTSLKYGPSKVTGHYECSHNQLKTLKGCPTVLENAFNCDSNQLTSLEHGPTTTGGFYCCGHNELNTLKGAPFKVGGFFSCENNQLLSLKHAPLLEKYEVFYCDDNYLSPEAIEEYSARKTTACIMVGTQKDPSELPIISIEEPQEDQKSQKIQERPYGDLHPSEIQWDSIESSGSRGFPMWEGVPKVEPRRLVPVSQEKQNKRTWGDLQGISERGQKQEETSNAFADARKLMAKTLAQDPGILRGYIANVAMLLHDNYGITDVVIRNRAAHDIIRRIFGDYKGKLA